MSRLFNKLPNCIVVPVYKNFEELTEAELASFSQLVKVLGTHQIFLFGPNDFDFHSYLKYAKSKGGRKIEAKRFEKVYFKGIEGYNRLLKSYHFYATFQEFHYMLVYQLDAYVFRDELDYWCSKGYDYIGAPWFEGYSNATSKVFLTGGNGGFSLRKIQSALKVLRKVDRLRWLRKLWYKLKVQPFISFENNWHRLPLGLKPGFEKHYKLLLFDYFVTNEDNFWTNIVPTVSGAYKIAEPEEAMRFSFEVQPSFLFKKNNFCLPFGCHAWEKYDPAFWAPYISIYA